MMLQWRRRSLWPSQDWISWRFNWTVSKPIHPSASFLSLTSSLHPTSALVTQRVSSRRKCSLVSSLCRKTWLRGHQVPSTSTKMISSSEIPKSTHSLMQPAWPLRSPNTIFTRTHCSLMTQFKLITIEDHVLLLLKSELSPAWLVHTITLTLVPNTWLKKSQNS